MKILKNLYNILTFKKNTVYYRSMEIATSIFYWIIIILLVLILVIIS